VKIEFDPAKDALNRHKHGVSLALAARIDWLGMLAIPDNRRPYGEERYIAATPIDDRLYVVVFTIRNDTLRVISLRKANRREIKRYETQD
jgi:uncharacterized DUF497 family protein